MYKKKSLFVTFEGIEGSGKSYQSKKLYKKLQNMKLPVIYTREPGGSKESESIRKILLSGSKNKFNKNTDTLLYLASRSEHIEKTLEPAIKKNISIICDRFIDSMIAYQVYGDKIDKNLINVVHKNILRKIKPDLTFILKVNINKAMERIKKRKNNNRYDKLSKSYYNKVQNAFLKISRKNNRHYVVIDNSKDTVKTEQFIFSKFTEKLNK
ncbi:dTMP kinase [Pelagibacteraceae bacterium]|nr:dTMP kinase [Pelagibacteraceae bacterium]